jgi:hypothetical protein
MDKRIIKTVLVLITVLLASALMPIFAQWYHQQTGMYPYGTVILSAIGGLGLASVSINVIWEEDESNTD